MAQLSPEERLQKWLRNHPKADQQKLDKFLAKKPEVAALFTAPPAPAAAAIEPSTLNPQPSTAPADTGLDFPDPEPPPAPTDTRPPLKRLWAWLEANPLAPSVAMGPFTAWLNLGIWATAAALVAWLIFRKRKN